MLLFIIALLIAGGVIAYVGDRLGTYVGKKRLTALGLRPRHTAMLYTVISGGLIAVLTLIALIGYDRTVQRALLYGPEILRENHLLTEQDRTQRLLIRREDKQAQIANARAQVAAQRSSKAQRHLSVAITQLQAAQVSLQNSRQALHHRQAQLATARGQLVTLYSGLSHIRVALRSDQSRLLLAEQAYLQAHQNVKLARAQYDVALRTVNTLTRQGVALTVRNAALSQQNSDLTQQNAALDAKNQLLLTQTTYLQGAHLIYHKGQEIGRAVIPTDLTVQETRQRLTAFLDALGRKAVRAGATPGDNGRAVRVVAPAQDGSVSEDDALDALAQSIAGETGAAPGVVVVAVAHYNAFGGEQTPVDLKPYDNLLVYSQGEFIAQTVMDGSLPENQILNDLRDFLTGQVQPEARSRGIIPRPDPETGEPSVGEPTNDAQTYALVKQIQRLGPGAVVTARAAADTYSSGPLQVQLSASAGSPVRAVPPAPVPPPILRGLGAR